MYNEDGALKTGIRFLLLFFIVVSIGLGVFAIVRGFEVCPANVREKIVKQFAYNLRMENAYTLNLKDNTFINESDFAERQMYITEIIDDFVIEFNYFFTGSDEVQLDYEYDVYTVLVINYRHGKNTNNRLWQQEKTLVQNVDSKQQQIEISEQVQINYDEYNAIVREFEHKFGLTTDSYVDIVFKVTTSGEKEQKEFSEMEESRIQIPLNLEVISVNADDMVIKDEAILLKVTEEYNPDYELAGLGGVLLVSAIFSFIILYNKLFNISIKSEYEEERDKILTAYGDIIVEILTPMDKKNVSIVKVKDFYNLVGLEDEVRSPIMFYEDKNSESGEFCLLHNNLLYVYKIKTTD